MIKSYVYVVMLFSLCSCLTIRSEQFQKDREKVSIVDTKLEPEISYSASAAINNDAIQISLKKTSTSYNEQRIDYKYTLIEKRNLDLASSYESHGYNSVLACLNTILFPIAVPIWYIMAMDQDHGTRKDNSIEKIKTGQNTLPLKEGHLSINDLAVKLPVNDGTALIPLNLLVDKNDIYQCKYIGTEKGDEYSFTLNIVYESGKAAGDSIEGSIGILSMELISIMNSPAAFRARLSNSMNRDIKLNVLMDSIYFIQDGKAIEGKLMFIYSNFFSGNYPDIVPANSYIDFNIRTYDPVFLKKVTRATYKMGMENIAIDLYPNKDTRKITGVTVR